MIWYVNSKLNSGSSDGLQTAFASLQQALDYAKAGDTILIARRLRPRPRCAGQHGTRRKHYRRSGRRLARTSLHRFRGSRRLLLDHMQTPDRQVVDLDGAEMHFLGVAASAFAVASVNFCTLRRSTLMSSTGPRRFRTGKKRSAKRWLQT